MTTKNLPKYENVLCACLGVMAGSPKGECSSLETKNALRDEGFYATQTAISSQMKHLETLGLLKATWSGDAYQKYVAGWAMHTIVKFLSDTLFEYIPTVFDEEE